MIILFSGTGNTRYCAEKISQYLGDTIMEVSGKELSSPEHCHIAMPDGDNRIIWMFPVYSWGIPVSLRNLMEKATITGGNDNVTHWMICTCGDDIGHTPNLWRRTMRRRNFKTATAFSVTMPNTYVFMKGFDVDNSDVESRKIAAANTQLQHITETIASGKTMPDEVTPGSFAAIKTAIIRPYFNAFCTSPKPFRATDTCIGCGKCATACPMSNISIVDKHPQWGKQCLMCTRCYHICPAHAIAYGKTTTGKGQYRRFLK